ncbi:BlaI/MecI/CopY family transcriptional regulator [Poriferisphaera sp. WC338]|uniref:BlaI/MecI/CopY family transcriptional regulator n=1 Tax=Poriferisphaera sp. WC338 TaxID=3425129 RepID=UPI003D815AB5
MSQKHRLGDLQFAIMQVLWEREEAAASEVHALLVDRGLALTTIKTMLRKMEERGLVAHRENGRQFIYHPLIAESEAREGMVVDLVKRMFSGDSRALVNHLIDAGEIDASEIDELKARLASQKTAKKKEGKR